MEILCPLASFFTRRRGLSVFRDRVTGIEVGKGCTRVLAVLSLSPPHFPSMPSPLEPASKQRAANHAGLTCRVPAL